MDNRKFMKWILAQHPNTGPHEDATSYHHSLFLENTRLQERKWLLKIYPSGYLQPLPRASARMAPEHCNKPPVRLRGPKQLLKHLRHLSQLWWPNAVVTGKQGGVSPASVTPSLLAREELEQISGVMSLLHIARADQIARETSSKVKHELTQTSFPLFTHPPRCPTLCWSHSWQLELKPLYSSTSLFFWHSPVSNKCPKKKKWCHLLLPFNFT